MELRALSRIISAITLRCAGEEPRFQTQTAAGTATTAQTWRAVGNDPTVCSFVTGF